MSDLVWRFLGKFHGRHALFMDIDTEDDFDLAPAWARIMEDPRSVEWNRLMANLQERAPEATPDEWWAEMERVFDTDWPQHLSR